MTLLLYSCTNKDEKMFVLLDPDKTGITFSNDLPYTEEFNTYTYRNFYNGGGVALGDINNDGLVDIFLSGNIVDNKLYINQGDWKFKDITKQAGVACSGVWSTGVSMVDINGDGWLDIYVCKAGMPGGDNRHNELFINQGNLTFTEESSSYGLDVTGLSIHSAFFDFDRDGDLDCYLLNNSIRSVGGFDLKEGLRNIPDPEGNKLFRNDNGKFVDVTQEAGLYSSNIGYGLGITLSDFNLDGWPDIFISNDFFERDYLYLNNHDGSFSEKGDLSFHSMSMGSMGADACDIDNDLRPDLFVTEMLPHTLERKKTKAQYENWDKYAASVKSGYHHQFPRNILQRNIGESNFLEVGRLSGVAATEWSWASLIQDFDNDGLKDLFVSNGIYKDLLDKDYLNFIANDLIIKSKMKEEGSFVKSLIDSIPSQPVRNNMFKNLGGFEFKDVSGEWGLDALTFSNGSAYGDLDNDGDLDLVVNNANMPVHIYKNNVDTSSLKSIQFELKGLGMNSQALGAKILIYHDGGQAMIENYTSKGLESTVDDKLHFGLGNISVVDSVKVIWPDETISLLKDLKANKSYVIEQETTQMENSDIDGLQPLLPNFQTLPFRHKDININLFARERLLIEMSGFKGPAIAVGDVNGDGWEDIFCGGGKNQNSALFITNGGSEMYQKVERDFEGEYRSETVAAEFIDIDNDGDLDLYVAHGGKTFSIYSQELNDILYINDGAGNFRMNDDPLPFPYPINSGDIAIGDYNGDGWKDIIIIEEMKNNRYGLPGSCFPLLNNGDYTFSLDTSEVFENLGMMSSIELKDINGNEWPDLVIAGKWMPITIINNNGGKFTDTRMTAISNSRGLWNDLDIIDFDGDGDEDLIAGNIGLNNFYSSGMKMFINDFDGNGSAEQIICEEINGKFFPIHDLDEMISQLPSLKKKYTYYNALSKASMTDMFDRELIDGAITYELDELRSSVFINDGSNFSVRPLPREVQYSSVNSFHLDRDVDNTTWVYCGGNDYQVKPQFGKQDASMGWRFPIKVVNGNLSFGTCDPLFIKGQIRKIKKAGNKLIFGMNNDEIKVLKLNYEQ